MKSLVLPHQLPRFTIRTHCLGDQTTTHTAFESQSDSTHKYTCLSLLGLVCTGPLIFQYQVQA